jgi:hypothetical protein
MTSSAPQARAAGHQSMATAAALSFELVRRVSDVFGFIPKPVPGERKRPIPAASTGRITGPASRSRSGSTRPASARSCRCAAIRSPTARIRRLREKGPLLYPELEAELARTPRGEPDSGGRRPADDDDRGPRAAPEADRAKGGRPRRGAATAERVMSEIFHRIRIAAGLPDGMTPTGFRHGGATELGDAVVAAKMHDPDLRPITGHATKEMVNIYDKPPLTWQRFKENVYQDRCEGAPYARVYAIFDMDRSGAGMTWDFFCGGARPPLIDHIEDRDLWRFNLEGTREIQAFIFSYPYDFDVWHDLVARSLADADRQRMIDEGAAIERKHHKDVAELVEAFKRRMVIGECEVWAANLPYTLTSDAGHLMAQGEPFAACYWDTPDGRVFSLRSTDGGLDVSEVAKRYGGGGHRSASGFRLPHGQEP